MARASALAIIFVNGGNKHNVNCGTFWAVTSAAADDSSYIVLVRIWIQPEIRENMISFSYILIGKMKLVYSSMEIPVQLWETREILK